DGRRRATIVAKRLQERVVIFSPSRADHIFAFSQACEPLSRTDNDGTISASPQRVFDPSRESRFIREDEGRGHGRSRVERRLMRNVRLLPYRNVKPVIEVEALSRRRS